MAAILYRLQGILLIQAGKALYFLMLVSAGAIRTGASARPRRAATDLESGRHGAWASLPGHAT
jgi:hypothetical protein